MKVLISAVVLVAALAVSSAEVPKNSHVTAYDYHRRFGIPLATKIKYLEEQNIKYPERIVGGSFVDISHVPYQVGLILTVQLHNSVCSASIITHTSILTAAHCYNDGTMTVNSVTVVLGSNTLFSGGLRVRPTKISVHPEWNVTYIENDIAVFKINPVTFTHVIKPIDLPSKHEIDNSFVGAEATASGYGRISDNLNITSSQRVSWVKLPIVSNDVCSDMYGSEYVRDTILCISTEGGVSTCFGDSGGPLVINSKGRKFLIGVTSYGGNKCEDGSPLAFTRVASYLSWISSQ